MKWTCGDVVVVSGDVVVGNGVGNVAFVGGGEVGFCNVVVVFSGGDVIGGDVVVVDGGWRLNGHRVSQSTGFGLFQTDIITIFTKIYVKKCPSSIQCRDLNLQPSEHESPPITTRPGLPLTNVTTYCAKQTSVSVV